MRILLFYLIVSFSFFGSFRIYASNELKELKNMFITPPESSRPGVYWYFMDGNLSKEAMTKDLESMKDAGIGSVVFLEVNVGIPRGKVDFLSDEWKSCFKHAVKECERLGISMVLGIGPGWTGSGGPWVEGKESMRHIVSSVKTVTGGKKQTVELEKPLPEKPYFGEGVFTPELKDKWLEYYEDIAVLAFPATNGKVAIKDIEEKALYYRAPYSSAPGVKQYIPREEQVDSIKPGDVVLTEQIVDLTSLFHNGSVTWDVPPGEWQIMRFGIRNNGAVTRPAPFPGLGFECDKTDTLALKSHLDKFTGTLLELLGERDTTLSGGLKVLHMDSWEMGAQNWSPYLIKEFKKRRGYDPLPYFPVFSGLVVGNKDISERFLWDLRKTMQELMLENHSLFVKDYAHRNGMQLSIEPYDMNPMQDLELGATADIPMCEFWSPGGYNTSFSAIEGSSLANIKGQRVVPSEAFTAAGDGWRQHPASMKNQTDWAFAAGINRLTYHTFQHQVLPDSLRPGMTMGPYGVHWDRNQTWWPYVDSYHKYVSRCQYLLQKGQTVSDILYLAPEEFPFVFKAPVSALYGEFMIDKREYNFDACPPSLIYSAFVENGKIKFPSGMEYSILILPEFKTMTVDLLKKISSLVYDGAVVVGNPPLKTPGLTNFPESDSDLHKIVSDIWGGLESPAGLICHEYGKGRVFWGTDISERSDNLYPDFELTTDLLKKIGVTYDFMSEQGCIRYIHKKYEDIDYFFISNRQDRLNIANCNFRVTGKQPYLWNPVTGEMSLLPVSFDDGRHTSLELKFDSFQSYFVVFYGERKENTSVSNIKGNIILKSLNGDWNVSFDTGWGGPANIKFSSLYDWSKSDNPGIKYYSGTAVYTKSFKFDENQSKGRGRIFLDLGVVKNIAKVRLNGKDLGVIWTSPWKVDITEALHNGENKLEIEIANLWCNRLIGDEFKKNDGVVNGKWPEWLLNNEKRPSDRYTFTTYSHYGKKSKLQESGLLGPVHLVLEFVLF